MDKDTSQYRHTAPPAHSSTNLAIILPWAVAAVLFCLLAMGAVYMFMASMSMQTSADHDLALATPDYSDLLAPAPPQQVTCEYATEDEARWLMGRWFPNAKFLEFNKLENSCLLEVYLLADASIPESSGYFYVLPGGKEGINGPIYNHRSKPQITIPGATGAVQQAQAAIAQGISDGYEAAAGIENAARLAVEQTGEPVKLEPDDLNLNKPFEPQPGETIQQALLRELKKAPHIMSVQETPLLAPVAQAYVLYDSNCPACTHLFEEMEGIAQEHNVAFNWVPSYLNEKGWVQAAHIIKTLESSNDEAVEEIRDTFTNPKSDEYVELMTANLNEADYDKARLSAAFLLRLNKMSPRILGTPLIFIEGNDGKVVSAYGAVTESSEWSRLVRKVL